METICPSRASLRGFRRRFPVGWLRIWEVRRRGLSFPGRSMVTDPGVEGFIRRPIRRQTGLAAGRMLRLGKGITATRMRIRVHRLVALAAGVNLVERRLGAAQSTISRASLLLGDRRFHGPNWMFRNQRERRV